MSPSDPAERLDSWKEIASYLRRDVRTVQRWEKKEGLPVYRHQHDKLGSVYAYRAELTTWFSGRQLSGQPKPSEKIKIAVLPFVKVDGKEEDDYFSEGLTDEMTTQVTRLQPSQVAVIARTTAVHYSAAAESLKKMKQELGVDYVLEGRVRRAGNRVRINAQLTDLEDQTQLWAETYERDLGDVLSVQAGIAQAIASEINLALNLSESNRLSRLQGGQDRVDPAAYDSYLKARYHLHEMTPTAISKSIQEFEAAIKADSNYASAYSGLAAACALLAMVPFDLLPPTEAMPRAEAAARKALELDDGLAEAHTALALVNHHFHWNWKEAEAEYRKAIELNPNSHSAHLWYSWLLLALSKRKEALAEIDEAMQIAQETDPQRLVAVHATRAIAHYFNREFEQASEECEKGLQLDGKHFMLHYILGRSCMRLGNSDKAIRHLKSAGHKPGEIPLADAALGLAYAVSGHQEETQKLAETLRNVFSKRYVPATYFGLLYAGLGDKARALAWLEKAYNERADGLTWINVDPMLDDVRSEPRFKDLLKRIGLVQ